MIDIMRAAITGHYREIGDLNDADCLIGQSFGLRMENGKNVYDPVNAKLARYAFYLVQQYENIRQIDFPTLLQTEIADIYRAETGREPSLTIKEARDGKYLDTWEVLSQSLGYMQEHELKRPVIIAQAHHVGRVALQAAKLGMDPIVAKNLPTDFDPLSEQSWTRSLGLWAPREALGYFFLKKNGKI